MNADIRAARAANASKTPGGANRRSAFPAQMRGQFRTDNGKKLYDVDGYATVFNRGYTMWDEFGEFTEIADPHMLDRSLATSPDVAFLLNHKGMTMARTKNNTLHLTKDDHGLRAKATLNADRADVQDLAHAISDGDIDEMSFAFLLSEGEWNSDFSEFRILQADIHRGDVSAVNFGANPWTNIGALSQDFMRMAAHVPESVKREAMGRGSIARDTVTLRELDARMSKMEMGTVAEASARLRSISDTVDGAIAHSERFKYDA